MTEQDLIDIGFKEVSNFTVTNSLIYPIKRNRHLSVGCIGSPNEMLYICETDPIDEKVITDLVCLHNFDYDGYLTKEKLKSLMNFF